VARSAAGRLSTAPELGASVGTKLRERRRALGLTLSEAARAAQISTSYLSSIETGNSVPSLPILARVVAAVELSLNEVLRDVGRTVVRTGRIDPKSVGVLAASHPDLLLEVACVVAEGGESGECPVPTADREVFVYALEGALEVIVDGAPFELGAGDSLDAVSPGQLAYRAPRGRAAAVWASIAAGDGLRVGGLRGAR
jgi:transcriptional regulator with XRE-family HTH domain